MRLFHLALALLIVSLWGFNFVVIKTALGYVPPFTLCTIRFFLATFPAVFFVKPPQIKLGILISYGLTMFALQSSLLFLGIHLGMPSGLASLLLHVHVFFTILLAIIFLGEEAQLAQIIGAIIALCGIIIIGYHTNESIPLMGFIIIICASFSWGVGNIISKKIGKINLFSLVVWGNLVAVVPLLFITLFEEGFHPFLHLIGNMNWNLAAIIFYISYPTTVFGFIVWSWLLNHYSVATVTPFSLLVPIVGMMSTSLILGEKLQEWKVVSAILVILGLCVNLLGPVIINKYKFRSDTVN